MSGIAIDQLTGTVVPSGGAFASKSVAILKPLLQQLRVRGPFVHAPSGAGDAEVACLPTSTRVGGSARGRVAPRANGPKTNQDVNE
jgi:hypothetical protein